jgi:hypothetical protein
MGTGLAERGRDQDSGVVELELAGLGWSLSSDK